MDWLKALLSKSDASADSVIVGGLFSVIMFWGLAAYDVGIAHHDFSPLNAATGSAAIIGAIGAAKRFRDGVQGGQQ